MGTAILDIDGTLVDTNYHHAVAWYRAFRQHGFVLPLRTKPEPDLVRAALEKAGASKVFTSVQDLREHLAETPLRV